MKLDRNSNPHGRGKYALIKLRESNLTQEACDAVPNSHVPVEAKAIDFGDTEDSDFFVIRLKDKYASTALCAYAHAAGVDDPEYGAEVLALALKALNHPNKKLPD